MGVNGVSAMAAGAALGLALAACTRTTTPVPSAEPRPAATPTAGATQGASGVVAGTMWCQWAGGDATVFAGDKPLTFGCDTADPNLEVGLFGDIENGDLGWMIDAAVLIESDVGPSAGVTTTVPVDWIELEDGTVCANAGHGATTGFDDKRLNYTCQVPSGVQTGLFGDVQVTDTGWRITRADFNVSAGGPTVVAPSMVLIAALGVPPVAPTP